MFEWTRVFAGAASVFAFVLTLSACTQTRSIQALPPRPAVAVDTVDASLIEAGLVRIDVRLRTDGAPLPDEVRRLRLRVSEIRLREESGAWRSFPTTSGMLQFDSGTPTNRVVLSTQVTPTAFDSVEVVFDDLYVEFDEASGGPLTRPEPPQSGRGVVLRPVLGETTTMIVSLNPGASVFQDTACRWHFLPFITVEE